MNEFKPFEQPSKTKVAIVAGGRVETIPLDLDVYVGVDAGCLFLLKQGLELSLAVGDFDSVEPEEFQSIQSAAHEIRTSVAEKNDTDLELAIKVRTLASSGNSDFWSLWWSPGSPLGQRFFAQRSRDCTLYVPTLLDGPTKLSLLPSSRSPYHSAYSRLYLCSFYAS